jgi:hypothetical protein
MTKKEFHEGDRVEWDSHGGTAVGEVEEEITDDTLAAKRTRSGLAGGSAVPGAQRQQWR